MRSSSALTSLTTMLRGRRKDWHDEAFEEIANRLGESMAALVALPDKYGHRRDAARLVAVIVFVGLAIFLAVPHFSLHRVHL